MGKSNESMASKLMGMRHLPYFVILSNKRDAISHKNLHWNSFNPPEEEEEVDCCQCPLMVESGDNENMIACYTLTHSERIEK